MSRTSDQVAVLIIRLWKEGDSASPLRARITQTLNISGPEEIVTSGTSVEEVLAAVGEWLAAFSSE